MELNPRLQRFFEFVKEKHSDQKRKYTNEPYFNHLLNVAKILSRVSKKETDIAIALGHDLLEDTNCCRKELFNNCVIAGFQDIDAESITFGVVLLTDQFTKEDYPELNRERRKTLEAHRLGDNPPNIQTIKYADLIDNTKSIVKHDLKFAKIYVSEKRELLEQMRLGDLDLFFNAYSVLLDAESKLRK